MKKQLLAFATLCPLAGVAHAQSSVTLYGLIDEGFEAVSNVPVAGKTGGGTKYALDAINGLNGTPLGIARDRGSGRWPSRDIHA